MDPNQEALNYAKEKGIIEKYKKGCLLPYLETVLSDHIPIIGSEIASTTSARKKANETVKASNPKTWL